MKSFNRQRVLLVLFIGSFWFYLHPISAVTQKGSIRIHLKRINLNQETISLSLYDVSDIIDGDEEILPPSKTLLTKLEQAVKEKALAAFTHTSDEHQTVEWGHLSKGSYLIIQHEAAAFGTMEPLLICLPAQTADNEQLMNVVVEPAIIQTVSQDNLESVTSNSLLYIPSQTISLQDVLLLFCIFSGTILVLSLLKYRRAQRKI